jgi:hypothetical protein
MLNNLSDQLTVLDERLELLRDGALRVIAVIVFRGNIDIDTRALARKHLCSKAIFA